MTTRVLHFVEASGGGVLSVIKDSIKTLQKEHPGCFDFTILFSRRPETPADLEQFVQGVELIEIHVGRKFFSLRDIKTAWLVARLSRRFDVVHCHSSRAGFIGRMARLFGGRRTFYSPHCYAFLSGEFSRAKRACVFAVESVLARVPGTVTIACGDSELSQARRVGGHSVLIRNGYSAQFLGAPAVVEAKVPLVVGVGRDSPQKDQGLFLRIAEKFSGNAPSFMWVGPSNSPIGTGWISRERSAALIESADVFLMTSRWEGLPVAGLEAMGAGLPLVVRNIPGACDLVEHGRNGFLFDTEQEARELIERLVSNPDLRESMGAASRALLEEKFSCGNYAALSKLYSRRLPTN